MDKNLIGIIDNLAGAPAHSDLILLLNNILLPEYVEEQKYLFSRSKEVTEKVFGNRIYIRGLIEFSNFCSKNCTYCGIRRGNDKATRFRLSKEEILELCESGYQRGFKTFVLQGGEDQFFHDDKLVEIVSEIKSRFPDCAITLSVGERDYDTYKRLRKAGADRFLLRHETVNRYEEYHPGMDKGERLKCLSYLKDLGYQTGSGFLVGLPHSEVSDYADDLLFLKELNPEMIGIGPFIAHKDTPLKDAPNGTVEMTKVILATIRLMLPSVLLPTTTALNTLAPQGLLDGLEAGANVLMLSLTPENVRDYYSLYEGKSRIDIANDEEFKVLRQAVEDRGFRFDMQRGDYKNVVR